MKKVLIVILVLFVCFSFYCKFFVYSYDLTKDPFELNLPSYYSDKYLSDKKFSISDRHEQFYSMSKKDIFNLRIGNRTFTDSLTLILHSSLDIKPLYLFYTLQVDSMVDIEFLNFIEIMPDSVERNEIPVYHGHAEFQISHYILPNGYQFKRDQFWERRENYKEPKITYQFYENGKYAEQNFVKRLIHSYVRLLYKI